MIPMNHKYQIIFKLAILFICWLPAISYSEALTKSETMNDDMLLQEIPSAFDASKYEHPVSGASKYDQTVTAAPSSVSVITAEEIKNYGYRNLAEILNSVRGFYVTYDRQYRFLGVRGFGLPGDYNSRILVLIDGHRLNDNIYDSALIDTAFPIDIDLIDHIEVIRGPSSSIYGSNAFFAIINIFTRTGRSLAGTEISGEAGTFSSYKSRLSYGNKFPNGLEMLLSASYLSSDGDDRLFFREFNSPETNNGIAKDLDDDEFKSFFSTLRYRDFTLQGVVHTREKAIPTAAWGTVFNERMSSDDDTAWLDAKYDHIFENQASILARINYNYYRYTGDYPFSWEPMYPDTIYNSDDVTGQWIRGEVQFTKTLIDVHKGTIGLDGQYNLQQDQRNYDHITNGVNLDDKRNSHYCGIYLQDEYTISHNLTLTAGIRLDYYNTFGATINPRAALVYNPFEKSTFKFIYGRAFRAPNAYELYYHDGPATQKSNPGLSPETIDTYELVFEQTLGKYYRGSVAGFYNSIENLISLRTDTTDGLLVFDNVDEANTKGIECEIEGKWPGGHEGRIGYTLQETKNAETGKILVNSPKNLIKLNCIGALIKEKLFLGVEEQYTSRKKTISGNLTDDFFITNVTLSGRNIFKTLEVSGSVYNLFDEKYEYPGSEEHTQDTIEQDGRTFRIKFTYSF